MTTPYQKSKRWCLVCGWLPIVAGCTVFVGWSLDLEPLKCVVPGFIAMNPLTAACFIAAGLSIVLQCEPDANRQRTLAAQCCAAFVMAMGLAKLGEYLFAWQLGWDRILFAQDLAGNSMAPNTALCFVLCGLALFQLDWVTRSGHWPAQVPAILLSILALVCLVGYGYGTSAMYRVSTYIPMAMNTAFVFQVLSIGILMGRHDRGVAAVLFHEGLGGEMARRMLPFGIALPCILGWLRVLGQRLELYDTEFGAALMVAITVAIFSMAVCWIAGPLNKSDDQRRAASAELSRTNQELRDLYAMVEERIALRTAELKIANAELLEKNQENEMFVYSVSHDLRSPLVNLQGFSQELTTISGEIHQLIAAAEMPRELSNKASSLIEEDMQRCIRFIQTSVGRLSGIIDALLRLSRAGRVEYEPQTVDLNPVVTHVIEAMSAITFDRGVDIQVEPLDAVWGDPTAMEQIFANLIGNAVNYLDPNRPGKIVVGMVTDKDPLFATYFVRDNGLGIPEAYHGKVFQALKRLHPKVAQGEGIGLAIIKRIIERHNGTIWFESTVDEGTTFYVRLPRPTEEKTALPVTRLPKPLRTNYASHTA